jgi:hypothetical protein
MELEHKTSKGSTAVAEVKKCVQDCRQPLA